MVGWYLKSPRTLFGISLHLTRSPKVKGMVKNNRLTSLLFFFTRPFHTRGTAFRNLILKIQGQCHDQGQNWWLHLRPSVQAKRSFVVSWPFAEANRRREKKITRVINGRYKGMNGINALKRQWAHMMLSLAPKPIPDWNVGINQMHICVYCQ